MSRLEPTVCLVDDDPLIRESVRAAVASAGLKFESYGSAEEFLSKDTDDDTAPRCLLVDVRLPGMSGLALQERLTADHVQIPIVMITGYATVSCVVQAMKAGADDFLEKPFHRQLLIERIQHAIDRHAALLDRRSKQSAVDARLAMLTPREHEVAELLIAGRSSKEIATKMLIGVKTVAKHRSRILEKMQVENVVELAQRLPR